MWEHARSMHMPGRCPIEWRRLGTCSYLSDDLADFRKLDGFQRFNGWYEHGERTLADAPGLAAVFLTWRGAIDCHWNALKVKTRAVTGDRPHFGCQSVSAEKRPYSRGEVLLVDHGARHNPRTITHA